ncbi:hypothetical protein YH65_01240 [Sulfurovum lithotrophicum]|uniref:Uncharacterized protein n=1 Tax=Sulfurovum lithotrophicum TaxID=206403 RepID=A0A7U4LZN1_9BACT|nr:hypothetical protein [Sulfurovum lithotrophicum]AKF24173.1 hypothetical protein YH65_01240 [Sulfurovum lithotrophicum]
MKVIIDLIEDIRESIGNAEDYILTAGLLKEDTKDPSKLIYAGEASLNKYYLDPVGKQLVFEMDGSDAKITIGELIPLLLISDMDTMMYGLRMDVNEQYSDIEIIGFGKNEEMKKYLLFIKL